MKLFFVILLSLPLIFTSCWEIQNSTENWKESVVKKTAIISTWNSLNNNSASTWVIVSSEVTILSENSPYKELYESKKWKLINHSWSTQWNFLAESGSWIEITYMGNPNIWWKTRLQINNTVIIDISDCLKWQNKEWKFAEDDPIFVKAECKDFYYGFTFNGKKVDHDFKDSMNEIWVSKSESKIAVYGGKLIIDFVKNDFLINENRLDMEKSGYILLNRVY